MSITVTSTTEKAETPVDVADEKSAPVAEAAELKTASESDTEENEAEESDAEDAEADEESVEAKDAENEGDKPKKKSGSQRRKERAERAEAEVTRLQRLVEEMALKGAGSEPKPVKAEMKQVVPDGKPNPDSFETHAEYVEALTDWKTDLKFKARDDEANKAKAQIAHEQTMKAHFDRVNAFKEKTDDYEEVIEAVGDMKMSLTLQDLLVTSDHGPELIYELAKSKAEFERVSKLGPIAAALEIGKLVAKIEAKASPEKKPEPKKLTNAPKPLEPVGGSKAKVAKSISDPSLSQAEYERIRREQMRAQA
jgi:hypothetical protein